MIVTLLTDYGRDDDFVGVCHGVIRGIGPDLQTPAITYDGKYVLTPFSGFQRQSSGISVIDTSTDTLVGVLPSNGGHHDCVIIPTKLEHMKHTRSCTL